MLVKVNEPSFNWDQEKDFAIFVVYLNAVKFYYQSLTENERKVC